VVRGARVLTLDTGVGWRAATGARCPWTIGNALDADERSGPRWTDDTWLARRRHGDGGVTRRLRSA
jgi:hypothetical protein